MTEKRCLDFDQSRMKIEIDGESRYLTGYAVVEYCASEPGTEFRMGEKTVERVKGAAIDAFLARKRDVISAFNHSPDLVLGRQSNGTLTISRDEIGAKYRVKLPDTTYARDLEALVERGDVKGASFMGTMKVTREVVGDTVVRWVEDLDIHECGPVTAPAYEATTAQMRSLGDAIEQEKRSEIAREHFAIESRILDLTFPNT